jgi:hypothetical protein
VRSGSGLGTRALPVRPGWPPGLGPAEGSRDERSARRLALSCAFAAIESFDGGVPEFDKSIPSRRRSSANSACNRLINSACVTSNWPCVPICSACVSICLAYNRSIRP